MAKKKNSASPQKKEFGRSPFSHLKGFAVSAEPVEAELPEQRSQEPVKEYGSFADEMALLGVEKMSPEDDDQTLLSEDKEQLFVADAGPALSEDEQFLLAMGELQVDFRDQLPEEDRPPTASARRMKQLKQGRLSPEESFDLHGMTRDNVAEKLRIFLQNAAHNGSQTVLVITGRGLHSVDGEPVLRNEAERFLATEGRKWVVEWVRAPKQYGGSGALVLFLKKQTP